MTAVQHPPAIAKRVGLGEVPDHRDRLAREDVSRTCPSTGRHRAQVAVAKSVMLARRTGPGTSRRRRRRPRRRCRRPRGGRRGMPGGEGVGEHALAGLDDEVAERRQRDELAVREQVGELRQAVLLDVESRAGSIGELASGNVARPRRRCGASTARRRARGRCAADCPQRRPPSAAAPNRACPPFCADVVQRDRRCRRRRTSRPLRPTVPSVVRTRRARSRRGRSRTRRAFRSGGSGRRRRSGRRTPPCPSSCRATTSARAASRCRRPGSGRSPCAPRSRR